MPSQTGVEAEGGTGEGNRTGNLEIEVKKGGGGVSVKKKEKKRKKQRKYLKCGMLTCKVISMYVMMVTMKYVMMVIGGCCSHHGSSGGYVTQLFRFDEMHLLQTK